jgi:hypothetical protein
MYFVLTFFCTILSMVIILKKMYIYKKKKIEKMSHSFNLKIEPKFLELLLVGIFLVKGNQKFL